MQRLLRFDQADGDACEQFALGEPFLDDARVAFDRPREHRLLDRHFLFVDAQCDQPRDQQADQRDKNDDESQPDQ